MPSRRRLRRLFRPSALGHTAKGIPYHVGNSFRGLRWMRRLGKKRADRDINRTKDGVGVVTHWPRPLAHGFVDPEHKLGKLTPIRDMTLAEVRRLRAAGGFRIHTVDEDFALMGRLGMDAVVEPKDQTNQRDLTFWQGVKKSAVRHDVGISGYALPGNAGCLPYMNAAGIPSHKIR